MGALPLDQHWEALILGPLSKFAAAEDQLETTLQDNADYNAACLDALREAMTAAIFVNHFSDIAAVRGFLKIPPGAKPVTAANAALREELRRTRGHTEQYGKLLREVANAVKHGTLISHTDFVDRNGLVIAVLAVTAENGEGKASTCPQVMIRAEARNGGRERYFSFRAVIASVVSAWANIANLRTP
jgi:hypothetical protein